jgi:hypothetical protein
MPMTLVEAAKLETRNLVRSGVIEQFARTSDVLRVLPFQNIQGNALAYNREEVLPGVAFRGVNEGYPESVGVINPATETLYIAGGDLDVDRFILQTMGQNVRSTHENMKIKALAQAWTTKFIKGDTTLQPREFDGLQVRLTGYNLLSAGADGPTGTNASGGDALSLDVIDQAIDKVPGATHILMSRALRRKFKNARNNINISGQIGLEKDDFGRPSRPTLVFRFSRPTATPFRPILSASTRRIRVAVLRSALPSMSSTSAWTVSAESKTAAWTSGISASSIRCRCSGPASSGTLGSASSTVVLLSVFRASRTPLWSPNESGKEISQWVRSAISWTAPLMRPLS